jgi:dynein heavy chain
VSEIGKVLSLAASSYLPPFLQLKERIQQEAVAAQDNVRFLACLEGPCQQLSKATPQQIPAMLPQVLNCIRIVWSLSKFYNTPERIVSLLQKLSNEIINRCCSALKVEDILTGNVLGVMEMLQQSMAAGELHLLQRQPVHSAFLP